MKVSFSAKSSQNSNEYFQKLDHLTCRTILRINRNEVNGFTDGCHN